MIATRHAPMFHQLEGLHIDKNITMGHLKDADYFIKEFFEVKNVKMNDQVIFHSQSLQQKLILVIKLKTKKWLLER